MRVLVVDHTAELGGAELALVRLCEALDESVSVRCLLLAPGPLEDRLRTAGVPVRVVPARPDLTSLDRHRAVHGLWSSAARLVEIGRLQLVLTRAVIRAAPDVVHTTSLKADLLATAPTLLARRRLVWHVHDRISDDYLPRPLVRLVRAAARLPHALVANSRATASTLPRPAVVAYPGYAPMQAESVARTTTHGAAAPPRSGPVVGIVGRLSATKGHHVLVEAAPAVLTAHPGTTFVAIGGPTFGEEEYVEQVRQRAAELGVASAFTWTGVVDDPRPLFDALDVCVHASPVPEPFGQVVVEAMVRGVPVVATDAGGVPEILGRGREGLGVLVPPGDPVALAAAVTAVLDDPDGASERANRAREAALDRFAVERTARIVTGVWRDVLRHGRRRRP